MSSIKNFLGYYKQYLQNTISQWFWINKLRFKIRVEKSCFINKDFKHGSNVHIRNNTKIRKGVILGDNVTIGSNTSLSNINVGRNSHIEGGVKITGNGKGKITLGEEVYIGVNNILDWSDNITIGDYVHIAGPSTALWTHSSAKQVIAGLRLNDKNPEYRPVAPIVIENNVYIGGNCTIYPGVTIGHHSIIAPNSAVDKNVEPYSLMGGVPVRKIKNIKGNQLK